MTRRELANGVGRRIVTERESTNERGEKK